MARRFNLISVCLIIILVLFAFYPVLKNNFVNWDDDKYVTGNPVIRNPVFNNLKTIFGSYYLYNYHPLTTLSYAIDYRLVKLNPLGYHRTNLFLHLLNSLLVFWFISLLGKNTYVALITAVLFGIHPIHVEPVAWISGRKDVLYASFYLAALISYIYYLSSNKKVRYYLLSLLLFCLSLLSKSMAVTLPLVFFLIDYLRQRKYDSRILIEKLPFAMLSLMFFIIALFSQLGAVRRQETLAFLGKIKIASYCVIFYLAKTLMPLKLSCLYPYPRITDYFVPGVYNFAFLALIILFIAVYFSSRYTRDIVFGCAFFLLTVFPTLQFLPLGAIIVADRYTYVPSIGLIFIFTVIFAHFFCKAGRNLYFKAVILSLVLLIFMNFIYLTRLRCRVWENDISLWSDAIKNYGTQYIPVAYYNRGIAYLGRDEKKSAFFDFKNALRLYYERLGLKQDLDNSYQKEFSSGKDYYAVFNRMGIQFAEIGRSEEAVIMFQKIIEKNPENFEAYFNLSVTYGNLRLYKYAINCGRKAIELNPDSAAAHFNLAVAYYFNKERAKSLSHLERAKSLGFKPPEDFLKRLEQSDKEKIKINE